LGAALGTGESAVAFSGSLVVYAGTLGFMFGWLGTRTWVARLVTAPDADKDHSELDDAAAAGAKG
jgi:hypothetical protein